MKLKHLILFLAVVLAACSTRHPVETRPGTSLPNNMVCQQLQAIDSLMWQQPDSALMVLVDFATTPKADSLSAFEGHYCQMLLSELLYKNDYGQSNREKLLKAVRYFDSIVGADETDARKADTRGVSLRDRNAFLDARAHYINGVGFYERDSVVEACAEYLKALEVMDLNFEEKGLEGNKAIFMANIYNRLGDFFSVQFMMDDAIACYEQALLYCLKEPTSSNGVSNILYHIGIQYDKKDSLNIARQYYGQALETVSNIDNLTYRNIVTSKALCDYQIEKKAEQPLNALRTIIGQTENEDERLTRYLTVGDIFFEEQMFDSAMFFLELAFGNNKDKSMQVQAADFLRIIYDSLGDSEKSNNCLKFMADNMKLEGENKALVSQLDNLFQDYLKQKQEKLSEAEHAKHVRKIVGIIVPIAVLLALAIIIVAKRRSRKLLKQQQKEVEQAHEGELRRLQAETQQRLEETERKHRQKEEEMVKRHEDELRIQRDQSEKEMEQTRQRHEAELEAERLAYEKEQDALRQSLRQHEDQVRASEKSLGQQQDKAEHWRQEFLKEPICRRINELLHGKRITTRDTSFKHDDITLEEEDFKQLREAVERHFEGFDAFLLSCCQSLKRGDLALCHLHLMGLGEGEIAALKSRTYSGIKKQDESIKEKLSLEESVSEYVLRIAKGLYVPQDVPQDPLKTILTIMSNNPNITREEMANQLGVSSKTIGRYLKKLDGKVRYVGSGYSGHWEVIE
ncbi:MAG: HTH domain-containing protein [Bacteroidales bacterium]|nr:HTH domain-containing protein [Bacteroidales bacterium]